MLVAAAAAMSSRGVSGRQSARCLARCESVIRLQRLRGELSGSGGRSPGPGRFRSRDFTPRAPRRPKWFPRSCHASRTDLEAVAGLGVRPSTSRRSSRVRFLPSAAYAHHIRHADGTAWSLSTRAKQTPQVKSGACRTTIRYTAELLRLFIQLIATCTTPAPDTYPASGPYLPHTQSSPCLTLSWHCARPHKAHTLSRPRKPRAA